jgi:hypothetical protein
MLKFDIAAKWRVLTGVIFSGLPNVNFQMPGATELDGSAARKRTAGSGLSTPAAAPMDKN